MSSVLLLVIAGLMRVLDAIWAFNYQGSLPPDVRTALAGHSLAASARVWLVVGLGLLVAGALVWGSAFRPTARLNRGVGVCAAAAGALSGTFVTPLFRFCALMCVLVAIAAIFCLVATVDTAAVPEPGPRTG